MRHPDLGGWHVSSKNELSVVSADPARNIFRRYSLSHGHQGRGATTEKDARQRRVGAGFAVLMTHLCKQGRFPQRDIRGLPYMTVEIAIGAFRKAERPMNV